MRHIKLTQLLVLSLMVGSFACAGAKPVTTAKAAGDDLQVQSATATVQSFNSVEGADLMAKLDAARERARAKQSPYWSAYAFDVRPGVAIDPAIREFLSLIHI